MNVILAIDQGTTGTTAVLINAETFELVDKVNKEFPQIFPKPGQVEHNLNDIWKTVEDTVSNVLKKNSLDGSYVKCIGITNQRETTCAFNKAGEPLCNAMVWQDRRTGPFCNELIEKGHNDLIRNKTGLPIDPYFSGTKIHWFLNNKDAVKTAKSNSDLLFGNVDTFLLYKLTSGTSYATDVSNASRTLLMNLESCKWDNELLEFFDVDKECLPEIKDSIGTFGKTKGLSFLPDGIPITGILGDQQAALFGQAGYKKGEMKCTYGTGAFMLINTGEEIVKSKTGLLSTAAYSYNGKKYYAMEGSSFICGAAVQWLRDNLKIIGTAPEIEELAKEVTDLDQMEYLTFFPYFTGIGSPYWRSDAKAAIVGMTRGTEKSHIARATLDGMALSINDLIDAMRSDTGLSLESLKVDGGAVANNLLMEIQATVSNLEIVRPKVIETTAYGAALAAGIGANLIKMEEIDKLWKEDKTFSVNHNETDFYNRKKKNWKATIKKLFL